MKILQGQAFDMQVTVDEFFECRLEIIELVVQENPQGIQAVFMSESRPRFFCVWTDAQFSAPVATKYCQARHFA